MLQELLAQEEYEAFYKECVTGDLVDVSGAAVFRSTLRCLIVCWVHNKPVQQLSRTRICVFPSTALYSIWHTVHSYEDLSAIYLV